MKTNLVKSTVLLSCAAITITPYAFASEHMAEHVHDHGHDPIIAKVMIDELELNDSADQKSLKAQAWVGKDLNKFWVKANATQKNGTTEEAEIQYLFSHGFASYWDWQVGVRQDIEPGSPYHWGVIGIQGLAPYFFEVDAAIFIGESGDTAGRFSVSYDLAFTQKLFLEPEVEVNVFGQANPSLGIGSGLSDLNASLRLRYELRREFSPYIGVEYSRKFGSTADYTLAKNEKISETEWVFGIRAWF